MKGDMMALPTYGPNGLAQMPTTMTDAQLEAIRAEQIRRREAAIAERQADEAAQVAERERQAHERGAAELEAYQVEARAAWLSSGGDEDGFTRNWPKLRDERLAERARERMTLTERAIEERMAAQRSAGLFEGF